MDLHSFILPWKFGGVIIPDFKNLKKEKFGKILERIEPRPVVE
jgi:hypothetical protein